MHKKNVLFVCVENSCRSQMAEGFARMLGYEQVNSFSSGSKPSGIVNPKAIAAMAAIGYDLSVHDSKSLDEIPAIEYDAVVTMGCGDACPQVQTKLRLDWQIPDPKHMETAEFAVIRDGIKERIEELLDELSR
jgi:protein-tyrosine-phosphatase